MPDVPFANYIRPITNRRAKRSKLTFTLIGFSLHTLHSFFLHLERTHFLCVLATKFIRAKVRHFLLARNNFQSKTVS